MRIESFSTSRLENPDVKRTADQVYGSNQYKDSFMNKICAGSISSVVGLDLRGNTCHIFAPKLRRTVDGVAAASQAMPVIRKESSPSATSSSKTYSSLQQWTNKTPSCRPTGH